MKKLITGLLALCLCCAGMPPLTASASETAISETATGASETENATNSATETETENPDPVLLPTDVVSTDDILLYSSACCVMDADTGEILYYKNMDDKHYPASITKVLTGLLLIENADLQSKITYDADAWDGLDYYTDMNIGMLSGEKLTVESSLHAILLASANEVCNGAAKYVSGSVSAFCDLMNQRAKDLGCTGTHFVNPNGLHDEDHYTTAHDMALISRAAIANPTFRRITGDTDYTVKKTNKRPEGFPISHKHKMLMYTQYHYDACIGGKTGYTPQAKNTLVTYAKKNGMTLVCVMMENGDGHIYPDTITALDYCFDQFSKTNVSLSSATDTAYTGGLPSLPFAGFDIETFHFSGDNSGQVTTTKDTTVSDLAESYTGTTAAYAVVPYKTALYNIGSIDYLTADEQLAGSLPVYAGLDDTVATQLPPVAYAYVSSESDAQPAFLALQANSEDAAAEDNLIDKLIRFTLDHLPFVIVGGILFLLFVTCLIVWLKGILTRKYHQNRYRKMHNKRLEEKKS